MSMHQLHLDWLLVGASGALYSPFHVHLFSLRPRSAKGSSLSELMTADLLQCPRTKPCLFPKESRN